MRAGPLNQTFAAATLCALVMFVGVIGVCGAGAPGKRIQFADSESATAETNQFVGKDDRLNPYKNARGGSSPLVSPDLSPAMPLERVTAPSKKTKELLERRKNWAYLSPKELMGASDEKEAAEKLDGTQKQKEKSSDEALHLTPEERFFLEMLEKDRGKEVPEDEKKTDIYGMNKEPLGSPEELKLRADLKEKERAAKTAGGPAASVLDTTLTGGPGIFESPLLGAKQDVIFQNPQRISPELTPAQKSIMNEFRQLSGIPPVYGSAVDPLKSSFPSSGAGQLQVPSGRTDALPSFGGFATPQAPAFSTITPSPGLQFQSTLQRPSEPTSLTPSMNPLLPALDPPARIMPVAPSFAAPRRPF